MADITIPKDDMGFDLNFTVQNSSGSPYDLTGYTIKLKVWRAGSSGNLKVDGSCTIVDAAAGTCKYGVQANDFDTVGNYIAELELTKAGVRESTKTFSISVTESA